MQFHQTRTPALSKKMLPLRKLRMQIIDMLEMVRMHLRFTRIIPSFFFIIPDDDPSNKLLPSLCALQPTAEHIAVVNG